MKFSFLYAHKKSDTWNTPLSIINELRARGHQCTIYSIFNEQETGYSDNGIERLLNDAWSGKNTPDVIMHMDFGLYRSTSLTKKYYPNAKWVFESGDDPQSFQHYNAPKAQYGNFDLVLSPDIRCTNIYKKHNINAVWWTHFADTTLYTYDTIPVLDAVCTRDPNEPFFVQLKSLLGESFITRRGLHGDEHARFLQTGKCIIQNSRYKEVTRRVFEGMLAKRLVLADRIPTETGIYELFDENRDIIFFDSVEEAADKIKYFSSHDNEREDVALNGYTKVFNNHTQKQRVDSLLQEINKLQ